VAAEAQKLWDKRAGEPGAAYAVFRRYLELGPERSLKEAARLADVNHSQVSKWSTRFNWVARARAFDGAQDQPTSDEAVTAMRKRHIAIAQLALGKATERLRDLVPSSLSVREAVALLETAVKIERLTREEGEEAEADQPAPVEHRFGRQPPPRPTP
jgi:hypothetical protein